MYILEQLPCNRIVQGVHVPTIPCNKSLGIVQVHAPNIFVLKKRKIIFVFNGILWTLEIVRKSELKKWHQKMWIKNDMIL